MDSRFQVSSAFITVILNRATQLGLDSAALCRQADIPGPPADHRQAVPGQQVEALWAACAAAGCGSQFGCELAASISTTCLQGLNILLDSAADLRASLHCLVRFHAGLANYLAISLQQQGDSAALLLRPLVPGWPHAYALDAIGLTLVRNIARRVAVAPAELFQRIELLPGQHCAAELAAWGLEVGQGDALRLLFPARWLAQPLPGRNEFLHHALRQSWEASAGGTGEALRLARFWLKSSDQPIEQIAARSGYSQASNFIRAFRKQYGITPKQFRLTAGLAGG